MKIRHVRLENFRAFRDQGVALNPYSCFVGANGAGKSTILAALNVFFQEKDSSSTDTGKLSIEDYFQKDVSAPIRITVTFGELNATAQAELAAYVRHGEVVVTAEAEFDAETGFGVVRHYGQRLVMQAFRPYFAGDKAGLSAAELTEIYERIRVDVTDLPQARSKEAKAAALRGYEAAHLDLCTLVPSQDDFYGVNSTGKLARFVQWVYVPAVKDAGAEGFESKNTALGKLIGRTVQTHTDLDQRLIELRQRVIGEYQGLLDSNRDGLKVIAGALERRLAEWAHPDVTVGVDWIVDARRSVSIDSPVAGVKTGDGDFLGSLARMGHGLQRSYLLALLQELAASDADDAPTLVLGCEEPELYQHPPQARHLAEVFQQLSTQNNQVIVTTHSPMFVSGRGFEDVRLVHRTDAARGAVVSSLTFDRMCERIRSAGGEDQNRPTAGLVAKIHQALQPGISEMLFTRVPILVEGLEDVAYITAQLHISGLWTDFRRLGCHLIAANGKDKLIQPLAIAKDLGLPVFVVFDADGDTAREDHRAKHERDNRTLMSLLDAESGPFPDATVSGINYMIWSTNLTEVVRADFGGARQRYTDEARTHYAQEGGLDKNGLFIADWMNLAFEDGAESASLVDLTTSILRHGEAVLHPTTRTEPRPGRLRPVRD